jgi:hypothetical protein
MPAPSLPLVDAILGQRNRKEVIRSAISGSWDTFVTTYPQRAWWRRKSTRAALLWEHSVENAVQAFDADDGVRPIPHDDTLSFVIDQQVLVRFKKADLELKTRNYPTFLAQLFHTHEEMLPGFEDLHRVEAAYVLNQYQTGIDWIGIVARNRDNVLWRIDLGGMRDAATIQPERAAAKETAAERVLRAKKTPQENSESEAKS